VEPCMQQQKIRPACNLFFGCAINLPFCVLENETIVK
jgi:hypothetical protein